MMHTKTRPGEPILVGERCVVLWERDPKNGAVLLAISSDRREDPVVLPHVIRAVLAEAGWTGGPWRWEREGASATLLELAPTIVEAWRRQQR